MRSLAKIFYEPWHPRGTYRAEAQETLYRNFLITTCYLYIGALAAFVPVDLALGITPWPMVVSIIFALGALFSIRVTSSYRIPAYLILLDGFVSMLGLLVVFRDFPFTILFWVPVYGLWAVFLLGSRNGAVLSLVAFALVSGVLLSPLKVSVAAFHVPTSSTRIIAITSLALVLTATLAACSAFLKFLEALRQEDRRRNEFLAVLSHELRNPLTPIENSLSILDRVPPGGEQALRARAVIGRQLGQLVRLVNDLLDVTRLSHNKVRLRRERVDLDRLVRETFEDHLPQFERAEVHAQLRPAPGPVWIDGDRIRLAQIIGNLLANAIKFSRPGDHASVSLAQDLAVMQAILRVSDTGVGMAPETLRDLFRPLVQADKTLDRSQGGLGLGLALVKGLVDLHGGEIHAHSPGLGQGAEFEVRLPLATSVGETPRATVQAEGSHRDVLIIEDNVDAAQSLRELLELSGHEVAVAFDGPSGIARAKQRPPQIVLCDIGLPGMDGYEVAQRLRAEPALHAARLVAVSGYALPEDVRRALAAGFDQHLAKPIDLEALEALLNAPLPDPIDPTHPIASADGRGAHAHTSCDTGGDISAESDCGTRLS